jgi:hypothetical protein
MKAVMKIRLPKETEIFFSVDQLRDIPEKRRKFAPRSWLSIKLSIKSPAVTDLGETQNVRLA